MECRAKLTLRGVAAVVTLCAVLAGTNAAPVDHPMDSVPASVREVAQRPMTIKSGGSGGGGVDADPFPISRGEPFVVDPANVPRNHGPITGFDARPLGPRSADPPAADEYASYDYDASKLEEVPFDYRGDPIDRKDVHPEPGSARPNDIVKPINKPQPQSNNKLQTPSDIYQFLNLPKQYSSSDFKFPLVSNSYANTKVQGSGSSSSSLSNHKMPDASTTTSAPSTTSSRYNPTVVKTTAKPTAATAAATRPPSSTSTTTTTTAAPSSQEYEEYDYNDYGYHPQDVPALSPSTTSTTTSTTTTSTSTTTTTTAKPTTKVAVVAAREPSSYVTPEPAASTTDGIVSFTAADATSTMENSQRDRTSTTSRPQIDSKLDGTSFADYDAIKPPAPFKPLPGGYQQSSYGDDKTYPLLTASKTPMTFTAHVSSGISLNQKEQRPASPELAAANPEADDASGPSSAEPATKPKPKPSPSRPAADHRFETAVHHHVQARPDAYDDVPPVQHRPLPNLQPQSRPFSEPSAIKTTVAPIRKPAPLQPYPAEPYAKIKPQQYVPPTPGPVDTSKFKPPKHVINHFIKTLPDEDNKSYALQTSFSIGMDGERTGAETRPGQGVGQVLMVKEGQSSEVTVDQPIPAKPKPSTASVPLVPPPRLVPKPQLQQQPQQQYPRPPWENVPKQPAYYPPPPQQQQSLSPKRDGPPPPPPPPQRTGLPNILPQFRPNAKIDAPSVQPHSATIERVQIPMDHLRPPPLPKPQFLKMDRNDEDLDEEPRLQHVAEKETRTAAQRTGPPQPARVTTLQMIQHGAPGAKTRAEDVVHEAPAVHIVYAAGSPPARGSAEKPTTDDSAMMMMMDPKDRSDVPVLKTKTTMATAGKPVKTGGSGDFPYRIVRPDDVQNASSPPPASSSSTTLEYQAYSPTRPEAVSRPDVEHQQLVPNLQDYVPVATRDTAPIGGFAAPVPQRPITATLKTVAADEGQRGPQLQNFQIPFQPSMKLPENTNGWSVVRKPAVVDGGASDRMDEAGDTAAASTEKFDPDNFKPHLVGGFVPIGSQLNGAEEKKPVDHAERA